jgi:hypothetical protein
MSLDLQKEAHAVLLDVFLHVCANALSYVQESSLSHLRLAILLSLFLTSVCEVLLNIARIIGVIFDAVQG